jgi:RimJ/RimL family protein N-acetyltransferase
MLVVSFAGQGYANRVKALLTEHAFASRSLAQHTSSTVLEHMAASASEEDRPGLLAAARFLAGEAGTR